MAKPIAVVIGDIHFTPITLELATASVIQAKAKAKALKVPLVLNGDILDTKAVMRGECVNRLIELLDDIEVNFIVNIGNHDRINERSDEHTLNFLKPYAKVIDTVTYDEALDCWFLPYYADREKLKTTLEGIPVGSTVFVHQGVEGAKMGEYVLDKSSLPTECFRDFRVIASHYHQAQDIKCGAPRKGAVGLFSYIGTPYTTSFAEANDGPKGFQVLMSDGTLQQVQTNLRKHVIWQGKATQGSDGPVIEWTRYPVTNPTDLVWVKLEGPRQLLDLLDKAHLGLETFSRTDYKLEKIYEDSPKTDIKAETMTDSEVLWAVIDEACPSESYKQYLKTLVKELL